MSDSNALVPHRQRQDDIIPASFAEAISYADAFAQSGLFSDTRSAAQCLVRIQAGRELGFGPFTSMAGIHIIQGKAVMGANLMAAKVKSSGSHNYRVREHDETKCILSWYEISLDRTKWEYFGDSDYTIDNARRAGLAGKDNWVKDPKSMLFARAMSRGVRMFCPHLLTNAYTPDEILPLSEGGEIIETQFKDAPPPEAPASPSPPAPKTPQAAKTGPTSAQARAAFEETARTVFHLDQPSRELAVLAVELLGGKPDKWNSDAWLTAARAPEDRWRSAIAAVWPPMPTASDAPAAAEDTADVDPFADDDPAPTDTTVAAISR